MSILYTHPTGWVISHEKFINKIYNNVLSDSKGTRLNIKKALFNINSPYKKTKSPHKSRNNKRKINLTYDRSEVLENTILHVKNSFSCIINSLENVNLFTVDKLEQDNKEALEASSSVYKLTGKFLITKANGCNVDSSKIQHINSSYYVFPENCSFYCKDVSEIAQTLENNKFNLILLDPPWWNKYIRRIKKSKCQNSTYQMMYNKDLMDIPIERVLCATGLVVVWCTNSPQHLKALEEEIFPKWGVRKLATWFWLKVTKSGETVLPFNDPLGKQPFEQIIFASSANIDIPDKKLVLSVPSALHSNKPPLIDLLNPFLPPNPKCLEIFARYLLPNWTSYGFEALRFQHISCFDEISTPD